MAWTQSLATTMQYGRTTSPKDVLMEQGQGQESRWRTPEVAVGAKAGISDLGKALFSQCLLVFLALQVHVKREQNCRANKWPT
jgi:hypothetical protein